LKVFIFLYPFYDYINLLIGLDSYQSEPLTPRQREYLIKQHNPWYINDLIRERYRKNGYKVAWLFQGTNRDNIELCEKSQFIEILADDILAPSFSWEYKADARSVMGYLSDIIPGAIERAVLGGYHRWDCVDRFAESLYRFGMDVRVDEDLTEEFFALMRIGGIPLVRTEPKKLTGFEKYCRQSAVRGKPWFDQT